jgi:hypothetical protein
MGAIQEVGANVAINLVIRLSLEATALTRIATTCRDAQLILRIVK